VAEALDGPHATRTANSALMPIDILARGHLDGS